MTAKVTVLIGTIGQGLWRSKDSGETWSRAAGGDLYMESDVRAVAVHPHNPNIIYAGTNQGCYRSNDGGNHWRHLPSAMDATPIWSLAIHPEHPETVLAGTRPSAIYRTDDGGQTWDQLPVDVETDCPPIVHTRVTAILVDPVDPETIWAGVEIDGIHRSTDGGQTWTGYKNGLNSLDVHGLAVFPGSPKTIMASTDQGLCKSTDHGETWQDLHVADIFPWGYCRGIAPKADGSGTLFIGNGNGPPGDRGSIQWTEDLGQTYHQAALSAEPNSTIWHFATHGSNPERIFAFSVSGQIFRSLDGGKVWTKLSPEFGEIRAMCWIE